MLFNVNSNDVAPTVTYTWLLFCSEGNAWMSAGAAATSRGATSGKRLSSVLRCFWKSTDAMMDR